MHWHQVSITTTPCWGSRLVALRARAVLEERNLALSVSARAWPARRYGMQWLARWLHAWRWRTWQCLVWPPTREGALLWCHMHKVYSLVSPGCYFILRTWPRPIVLVNSIGGNNDDTVYSIKATCSPSPVYSNYMYDTTLLSDYISVNAIYRRSVLPVSGSVIKFHPHHTRGRRAFPSLMAWWQLGFESATL